MTNYAVPDVAPRPTRIEKTPHHSESNLKPLYGCQVCGVIAWNYELHWFKEHAEEFKGVTEWCYGAEARAMAQVAGVPEWMWVTTWPVRDKTVQENAVVLHQAILSVPCPRCGAQPAQECFDSERVHLGRITDAEKAGRL